MLSDRKLRKLMMGIISIFLVMSFTAVAYVGSILIAGTMENRAIDSLNRSDYYNAQADLLETRVKELTVEAELPESIIDGVFLSEEVVAFTKEFTTNAIKGYETDLNTAAVKELIKANLIAYMEAENVDKAWLQIEPLNAYLAQAEEIYEQTINNSFVNDFHAIRSSVRQMCIIALCILAVICLLCMVFIYKLVKMRRKTLSYIVRSLIAAAILTGAPAVLGIVLSSYRKIAISPEYLVGFAKEYVNGIFSMLGLFAGLFLILLIGCQVAAVRIKSGKKA